jgi:predicted secreted protein
MSQAIAGFFSQLYVDVGGGSFIKIAEMKEVTIRIEADVIDVSSHSTIGWKDNINGLKQWSGTTNYLYIATDATQDAIYDALIGGTSLSFVFTPRGDAAAEGDDTWEGSGKITSWELAGPNNDASAAAVDILGTGALSRVAIPAP